MYSFGAQMYRTAVLSKSPNTIVLALVAQYLHDETKQYNHVVSVQPKVHPITQN